MNRTYEIMFIVRTDVEEAELDKLIEGFSGNVTHGGGEVKSVEKMGRRRLAYTVRKFNDGFYVLMNVAAQGSLITEIERRLRVSEQVIKFITVRMDEVAPDEVRVTGATGRPAPEMLKIVAGYEDGVMGQAMLGYAWPDALAKAQLAAEIIQQQMVEVGLKTEEIVVEYMGYNSIHGPLADPPRRDQPRPGV